ncbi:unnamed protein product [Trichogramma brassicae]|uniref:Uncharacterized protein n=1 Tax=Trichogramma brassicae TaxID=86971 RepID=A0A6H5IT85_9HYME|nr:unnamed protein product [Trichogramma brassicae]
MSSSSHESDERLHNGNEENNAEQMDHLAKVNFEKLKRLREKFNWEIEKERLELYNQLVNLIHDWKGQLPNLWDIFRPEEMDWFLAKDLKKSYSEDSRLIFFVARTGYTDKPIIDEDGKPLLRRTTAVHRAGRIHNRLMLTTLFQIYDRFDLNYTDKSGYTHLHAASELGEEEIVEKFFELGDDRQPLVQIDVQDSSGNTPLHLALDRGESDAALMLLKKGADVNLANEDGETALHLISNRDYYWSEDPKTFVKTFFKFVEARDKLGHTPLEQAVTSFMPEAVDALLNRGADVSNFPDPEVSDDTCTAHINEIICRRFCLRWALDPFMQLTRYRLPILCGEMILKNLKNEDLCLVPCAFGSVTLELGRSVASEFIYMVLMDMLWRLRRMSSRTITTTSSQRKRRNITSTAASETREKS